MKLLRSICDIKIFLVALCFLNCDDSSKNITPSCPGFEFIPASPYEDPIWHPSGDIIGFNHRPIKEIKYTYGYDCPWQATYLYNEDSIGFYLINKNGSNKRRIYNSMLLSPAWSHDGKWIAFVKDAQIFKMPFDGESFDTTAITQLTFEGRNFFPAWSPDGKLLAYDNTICGSAATPIPPNSCGILVMDTRGNNKRFIGPGRMPYWDNTSYNVYSGGIKYNIVLNTSEVFFDARDHNVAIRGQVGFNNSATVIGFIGNYTNTVTQFLKLFSLTPNGENLKTVSEDNIMSFSWSTANRIVYLNYDYMRIDEEKGALWVMNEDGSNQRQLTFNHFLITQ